jgi:excisionase family DNA binding protein
MNNTQQSIEYPFTQLQHDISELKMLMHRILSIHQNPTEKENILDLSEAAEMLKLSKSTIYKMTALNTIPVIKREGAKKLLFSREALEKWLVEGQVKYIPVKNLTDNFIMGNLKIA